METKSFMADAADIRKAFANNLFFIDDRYMVYLEEHEGEFRVIYVSWKMSELMANLPNGGQFHASIVDENYMELRKDSPWFLAQIDEMKLKAVKANES